MTGKLKITAIKPYPVWVGTRNQMLVKVETDQGIFGWGESGLSGREKAVTGAEGWSLPLSPSNARKAEKATTRKIVLGARHSTIKLHKNAVADAVPAKAYTVEPTGDVTFVQAFLSGAIVNISVPPSVDVAPDEQIWLEFDQDRMHLFDGETEMAIRAD